MQSTDASPAGRVNGFSNNVASFDGNSVYIYIYIYSLSFW